jgi:hypothetical protein
MFEHYTISLDVTCVAAEQAFVGKPTKSRLRVFACVSFFAKTGKATFRNDAYAALLSDGRDGAKLFLHSR